MRKLFKKIWNDPKGNALVMAGALLPLLIGAAGLATDTIQWTLWKRQLQRAADSAALAGVYDRESSNGQTSTVSSTVNHDLAINLHTWMTLKSGYPQVAFPADSANSTNQVRVSLAVQRALPFSSVFVSTAPTIIANATAASISAGGSACIQALETSASMTGITNTGNTTINASECILYSNSPSTNSASAGGSSIVNALAVAAVGGIQQSNNWNVKSYRPYSPALADPFAGVNPNPSDMKCAASSSTKKGVTTYTPQALTDGMDVTTMVDSSGAKANCFTSLSVGANRTLTLPDNFGPVYINAGSVDLKGTFTCNGCTIVLTNSDPSPNATIGTYGSNAQADNNITAPTSGPFKGIAVYQDRRATDGSNKVNGGATSNLAGALYFPKSELELLGNGNTASRCLMMVARRVKFSGNSTLSLNKIENCGYTGLPQTPAVKMVRLVA